MVEIKINPPTADFKKCLCRGRRYNFKLYIFRDFSNPTSGSFAFNTNSCKHTLPTLHAKSFKKKLNFLLRFTANLGKHNIQLYALLNTLSISATQV